MKSIQQIEWEQSFLGEEEWVSITHEDREFAYILAQQINKDYPDKAKVENDRCWITRQHKIYCENYVLNNCSFKDTRPI